MYIYKTLLLKCYFHNTHFIEDGEDHEHNVYIYQHHTIYPKHTRKEIKI